MEPPASGLLLVLRIIVLRFARCLGFEDGLFALSPAPARRRGWRRFAAIATFPLRILQDGVRELAVRYRERLAETLEQATRLRTLLEATPRVTPDPIADAGAIARRVRPRRRPGTRGARVASAT